jgi:hypothetical protein
MCSLHASHSMTTPFSTEGEKDMKLKVVLVGLVVASLSVSAAIAAPPPGKGKPPKTPPGGHAASPTTPKPGKGKPPKTGENCKPKVTVVLKGTVESAAASSLTMDVTHSNRWGRAWAEAGTATVAVDQDTKVRRNGNKTLAAQLVAGDWVLVQARACKADLADEEMPALTAARIVAHPAKTTS